VVVVVVKWRCWMVVAEGHCGERGAAAGNPKIPHVSASFLLFFCFSSLLFGLCFMFLSPFSRLASLSVTAFSPSPKISPPLFVSLPLFISRKEGAPPALSHRGARGKWAALPVQGKVAGCLQGMVSLSFIYHVGRVCGSMCCCQFYASGREIN